LTVGGERRGGREGGRKRGEWRRGEIDGGVREGDGVERVRGEEWEGATEIEREGRTRGIMDDNPLIKPNN
jgi:hypothetical protein